MSKPKEFSQSFFHGTKAALKIGDLVVPGNPSNYEAGREAKYVYLTSNLNVAIWATELAIGESPEHIYVVEPNGDWEDDPNVTDKRFPGNPTNSFRTASPLRVVGVLSDWQGHTKEEIEARKEAIKNLINNGAEIVED